MLWHPVLVHKRLPRGVAVLATAPTLPDLVPVPDPLPVLLLPPLVAVLVDDVVPYYKLYSLKHTTTKLDFSRHTNNTNQPHDN
jgi:hypothetical protein